MRIEILATANNETLKALIEDAKERIVSSNNERYINKQMELIENCRSILLTRGESQ